MEVNPYNSAYFVNANFIPKPDRRQQNVFVEVDRRSGVDRRQEQRYILASGQNLSGTDANTQFIRQTDRRKENIGIQSERRSGADRREESRFIPLSFGNSQDTNTRIRTVYIGKVLPCNLSNASVSQSSTANSGMIGNLSFDSFVHAGIQKDISSGIKITKENKSVNSNKYSDLKDFISNTAGFIETTSNVFKEITAIIAGMEAIRRVIVSVTKKK